MAGKGKVKTRTKEVIKQTRWGQKARLVNLGKHINRCAFKPCSKRLPDNGMVIKYPDKESQLYCDWKCSERVANG